MSPSVRILVTVVTPRHVTSPGHTWSVSGRSAAAPSIVSNSYLMLQLISTLDIAAASLARYHNKMDHLHLYSLKTLKTLLARRHNPLCTPELASAHQPTICPPTLLTQLRTSPPPASSPPSRVADWGAGWIRHVSDVVLLREYAYYCIISLYA